ncbi:amino acid polyamine transporter I [Pyrenophora seminiperda CCB06]|uniref:Amino acid polyamine transporter I n=1 Tax=Pyrenophora seminiperda CCB06 TaxID=1302712 RepID=A0A3M7LX13_9PLEO|nr:amino acid polyamine transporter I [Pyrenophora seminiperda CCB06]
MNQVIVSDRNRTPIVEIVTWFTLATSLLAFFTHAAIKFYVFRSLTTESWFVLVSVVFCVAQSVAVLFQAHYGFGTPMASLSDYQLESNLKNEYAATILLIMSLGFSKLAVVAFVHNLTPSTLHRRINFTILALVSIWLVGAAVVAAFECRLPHTWDRKLGKCLDRLAWWNGVAICNIITELAIVAIELGITAQLHVQRQRKVAVMALFSCRLLVMVAAAIQLGFFTQESQDASLKDDLTLGYWRSAICSQIMQCLAIVTTCLPYTKLFMEGFESGLLRLDDLRRRGEHTSSKDDSKGYQLMDMSRSGPSERSGGSSQRVPNRSIQVSTSWAVKVEPAARVPSTMALQQDDLALAKLGKKAVLKTLPKITMLTFHSVVSVFCRSWASAVRYWSHGRVLLPLLYENVPTNAKWSSGGPAGVIYGYLTVWVGTISVFMVLSELVSMAPTSGGQYHWVSMLAPRNSQKLLSYVSGWLTLCGWLASLGSGAFLTGGLIQGLMVLCQPDSYVPHNWHVTLLYWAVIGFAVFINVAAGWLLPKFEGALLILHILGFFAILIPLIILGPQGDAKQIFTTFVNNGGWDSQGLSFCIGIMGSVFAFVGGDGPIHLSEEIQNAQIVVPRSIMTGIAINGSLGFGMVLTMLFRMGDDLDAVTAENPAYPFIAIFHRGVQSRTGAAIMTSIVMVLTISANVGFSASTSRICWAFARDRGIPGWRTLSKVSDRTSIPVYAVTFTSVIACLLGVINIGSTLAFNGVISVAIAGLFSSYLLTSSLLLYRRCTGAILPPHEALDTDMISTTSDGMVRVTWGPWRIPGALGIANNTFACTYLSFVFFFSFWPSFAEVTPANMNWAILVFGFVAIVSAIYYAVWARNTYHGPVVDVEAEERVRRAQASVSDL